ncbi:arylsulfatase [Kamptonema cortianum]|nr:arylsulfatase [Geitlerinema splendidum]MDK3156157.1 arylsulfatase [Kamptonema cortianum]
MLPIGLLLAISTPAQPQSEPRPNIIYILADDLGYGELGSYGQKIIQTPNLDQLAAEGIRFTQHYSGSPVCAPTRSTILEGKSTRTNWVRENREFGDFTADGIEGQDPLPENTYTIGRALQQIGYKTACIGKWGLGGPGSSGEPNKHGFDYFFGYLCQRQAHNFYPTHLWQNTRKYPLDNPKFNAHQAFPKTLDPTKPSNYDRYKGNEYSNDVMRDKALWFIEENQNRPFFLYLPFTIPHVALQVPDDALAQYDGVFKESPYLGGQGYLPHIRPQSAYAAMITRLDTYVGQIIETLKEHGLDRNTLVMFSSDNGPTWVSGINPEDFNSTAGLRGRKAQLWEGGIRVPMIAWWPDKIKPQQVTSHVSAQWDIFATVAEITGARAPRDTEGVSFLPTLLGSKRQTKHRFLYWEFAAQGHGQAVRMGDWKGIRFNRKGHESEGHLFLYNLRVDPTEKNDVSSANPQVVKQIEAIMATRIPAHWPAWNWEDRSLP